MPAFYHGTAALFDQFDDSQAGKNSSLGHFENGRGTYLSSHFEWATRWENRFGGPLSHTKRVDIEDGAWNKNFLSHDRVFTRDEAAQIAADAAGLGYLDAAETIAQRIRANAKSEHTEPALTGRDIAMLSRYSAEINLFLEEKGYYGYRYSEIVCDNQHAENAIFFKAKDIPLTTPVNVSIQTMNDKRIGYKEFVKNGVKALEQKELPQAIDQNIEKLSATLQSYASQHNHKQEQVNNVIADIRALAALGIAQGNYDPLKMMHPLKLSETAVYVHMNNKAGADLSAAVAEFVTGSMKQLGHDIKPARLPERPVKSFDEDQDYRHDTTISAFRKRLADSSYIASEQLSSARSCILRQYPDMATSFERLLDALHFPGVDFSLRDATGHALNRALNGQMEPKGGETTLANLKENLTYNSSSSCGDCTKAIDAAVAFGVSLKSAIEKNKAPETLIERQPHKATSRFSPS
ncbi:MAG: hypothetical protein ACK4PK_02480 [Alphaproteobacteria bacterium]